MIKKAYAILTCSGLLLIPVQASALQLTNRDTSDHKLIVTDQAAGQAQEITATPSQILDGFCLKGCTIQMSDGQEYEFEGNEIVSIEEGLIFMDEPADGGEAQYNTEESPDNGGDVPEGAN
jgi:hypothetical protein